MPTYTDPGPVRFEGAILHNTDTPNSSAFIEFPFSVLELFGVQGRVPVRATFDGIPYAGSLMKMGEGNHLLLIQKAIREQLGKEKGAQVSVTVKLDTTPRRADVPPDLASALAADPDAERQWAQLAYSHQKEYVRWIVKAVR
jgi:hypothetical protein